MPEAQVDTPQSEGEVCTGCKAVMPVGAKICTSCGRNFKTGLALPGADAEEVVIEDDASTWLYYKPLVIKIAAISIVIGIIGGGALGLKALVRKQIRENLRSELKTQLYDTNGSTDRVNDPANNDLLLEAWVEAPSLRPAAARFIRSGKNYRPLFLQGYDDLSEEDRVVLVTMGLEWDADFSGELVDTLDDDYEDFGPELRNRALLVLERVDGPESVKRLRSKFDDGAVEERSQITESLVQVKDGSSTDTLIELFGICEGGEKGTVINGLARKATESSLAFVRSTAEGSDKANREMACDAMAVAGSPALETALQVACHKDKGIRKAGGEAVADIVRLLSRRYILRTVARKSGNFEAKREKLAKMQAEANFCGEYRVCGVGERSISGAGRSGSWEKHNAKLGYATVTYAKGILTVTHNKQTVIAEVVDQTTLILPLDPFHREGFPATNRKARCTIDDGTIAGKYVGEIGVYTATSSDSDSFRMVSYKASGLVFEKKK